MEQATTNVNGHRSFEECDSVDSERNEPIIETKRERYIPDLKLSKKEARLQLSCLHEGGDGGAKFTFFKADDRKNIPKDPAKIEAGRVYHDGDKLPPRSWCGTLDDSWEEICEANQKGYGVFVAIQQLDDSGARETKNVLGIRTCVNDLDHGEPPKPYPVTPSFSVRSSEHGRHDYFLTAPGELTVEEYKAIQGELATTYGGDKQVTDTTRVMRLAGTYHRKTRKPFLCTVKSPESVGAYTGASLLEKFGRVDEPKPKPNGKDSKNSKNGLVPANVSAAIDGLQCKPRYTLEQATDALMFLREEADDRTKWVEYGLALKRSFGEEAKLGWMGWSALSDLFNEEDAEERWRTFNVKDTRGPQKTVGSIIHDAKAKGWKPKGEVTVLSKWPVLKGGNPDAGSIRNVGFFLDTIGAQPWYNEFNRKTYVRSGATDKCLSDDVVRDLWLQMHEAGCRVTEKLFEAGLLWAGQKRTAHPVRHYLAEVQQRWDGKLRIDTWLSKYAGVKDKPYTRTVGRKWLIGGVRRVREPGCKCDNMLVLEGSEYAGKSRLFKILAGEWFTDGVNLGDDAREVIERASNAWVVECQELTGLSKRDVEAVKAFCSRQVDRARAAFGHFVSDVPRQFILGGTTNESRYLMSKAGNRRFWCVEVGKIDLAALERDRDQLWAEAAHYEAQGERIYLTPEEFDQAVVEQQKREVIDPIEERLGDLISGIENGFIATECLYAAVGLQDVSKRRDAHAKSIARVMRANEWTPKQRRKGGGERLRGYYNGESAELSKWYEWAADNPNAPRDLQKWSFSKR